MLTALNSKVNETLLKSASAFDDGIDLVRWENDEHPSIRSRVNFWSVIERVSCFFTHVQKTRKKKPNVYCEKPRGELSNQSFFSSSSICKTPIHQTCRKKKRWVIYETSSSLWFGVITSRGGKKFEVENQNRTFEWRTFDKPSDEEMFGGDRKKNRVGGGFCISTNTKQERRQRRATGFPFQIKSLSRQIRNCENKQKNNNNRRRGESCRTMWITQIFH